MRLDFEVVTSWVEPHAHLLDLGCGDGALLEALIAQKQVNAYGFEIDPDNIQRCIERGLNVLEYDIETSLSALSTGQFDTIVMSQAIQTLEQPHLVLKEMVRVAKECIVTFPNFGHWRSRLHLLTKGRMPVSDLLPYEWYDTPNIHFCTFKDFDILCRQLNIRVLNRQVVTQSAVGSRMQKFAAHAANLFGETALYRITK